MIRAVLFQIATYVQTTRPSKSMKFNACHRGIVVAGPGTDITSPIVNMHMFNSRLMLRNSFREKDVVLE